LTLPENTGTVVTTGGASSLTTSGNLTFTGTGNRITGDFSNATLANRVAFQTSTTNSSTVIQTIPNGTSTTSGYIAFGSSDTTNSSYAIIADTGGTVAFRAGITGTGTYEPMTFQTGGSERMRIDTSGFLLVGNTTSPEAARLFSESNSSTTAVPLVLHNTATGTNSINIAVFYRNSGSTGAISTTNNTTAYNTSSDYRLKENVAPMTGALATVAQLNPVTYTWIADGSAGQGFIAHELQEVVPECVTGEKDAIDANGNPQYQGVDTSFLVATLTAAIQELKAELDEAKARIASLEGNVNA
jgi:hypothetical protein